MARKPKITVSLQCLALYVARTLGVFAVAQYLTRKRLRILCYHGLSIGDEHEVVPYMFMRKETFERRMQILKKRRVPVIALDAAVRKLKAGEINSAETVITFDDGWASNLTTGLPILERFGYPACIYVTTEHLTAGAEAFNVALFYMLCRSRRRTLKLQNVHPRIDGTYDIAKDLQATTIALIDAAENAVPLLADRQQLLRPIAGALGMDLDRVLENGRFHLLRRAEIEELYRRGIDIQLHTHTHRLPDSDFDAMAEEIEQNRDALKGILGVVQSHFCFPSGKYYQRHLPWLMKLGIASATTCDPGLNDPGTPVMLLKRYVDSDQFSAIRFEAEICGLRELARNLRSSLKRYWPDRHPQVTDGSEFR